MLQTLSLCGRQKPLGNAYRLPISLGWIRSLHAHIILPRFVTIQLQDLNYFTKKICLQHNNWTLYLFSVPFVRYKVEIDFWWKGTKYLLGLNK